MQWQKSNGYIYNSTDLGTITDITVTRTAGSFTTYYGSSKEPSGNTTVGGGYFKIVTGSSAAGKSSKVEVTFEIEEDTRTEVATIGDLSVTTYNFGATGILSPTITPATGLDANAYTVAWTEVDNDYITLTDDGEYIIGNTKGKQSVTVTVTPTTANATLYKEVTKTFELKIVDPNANDGSQAKPFTCAEAKEAIDEGVDANEIFYVKGYVSNVQSYNSTNKALIYWLSDDRNTTKTFECYNGKGVYGADFSATTDLKVGDYVVVKGKMLKYNNSTYEFAEGNELVSRIEPTPIATIGELSPTTVTKGDMDDFTLAITPAVNTLAENTDYVVTWTSNASSTLDVDDGTYEAKAAGTAKVTVTVTASDKTRYTNVEKEFTVTVTNPSHDAIFMANGDVFATVSTYEGDEVVFPTTNPSSVNGFAFVGWAEAAISGTQASAPNFVTSATMDDTNVTYYAVFAIQSSQGGSSTIELTNQTIKDNASGKSSYSNDYNIDGWTGKYLITSASGNYFLQLGYNTNSTKSAYNSHLTTPNSPASITSVTINTTNSTASGRTFYLCSATNLGCAESSDATFGEGSTTEANGSVTINVTGNPTQFHIYPNGTACISSISFTYNSASYSDYCTTVPTKVSITVGASKFTSTYYSKYALVVPTGLTAYTFKVNASNKLEISETINAGQTIAKDQAVILYGDANTDYDLSITGTDGTKDANNVLHGFDEASTTTGGTIYYRLTTKGDASTIGFYWGAENGGAFTVGAHKAYVAVDAALSFGAGARMADIFAFDEANGIGNVNGETITNNRYFDLQGRRIAQPTKGLYIVNGKKMLVK